MNGLASARFGGDAIAMRRQQTSSRVAVCVGRGIERGPLSCDCHTSFVDPPTPAQRALVTAERLLTLRGVLGHLPIQRGSIHGHSSLARHCFQSAGAIGEATYHRIFHKRISRLQWLRLTSIMPPPPPLKEKLR